MGEKAKIIPLEKGADAVQRIGQRAVFQIRSRVAHGHPKAARLPALLLQYGLSLPQARFQIGVCQRLGRSPARLKPDLQRIAQGAEQFPCGVLRQGRTAAAGVKPRLPRQKRPEFLAQRGRLFRRKGALRQAAAQGAGSHRASRSGTHSSSGVRPARASSAPWALPSKHWAMAAMSSSSGIRSCDSCLKW